MTIEIINFKSYERGSLIGFVDFFIPKMGLEIYGSSIHQKDGRKWVNFPSKEYKDANTNETKWAPIVRFREKEHMNAFVRAVLKAVDEYAVAHQNKNVEEDDGCPF